MPLSKSVPEVLIVGGGGYIGSHMAKLLHRSNWQPVILDNFSTGHREAAFYGVCFEGDVGDPAVLEKIFFNHRITAVMHFSAFSLVEESCQEPAMYYRNNVCKTQVLLDVMLRHEIRDFIFSSTAAVYGEPVRIPIDESHPLEPINPYGVSKCAVERILSDYSRAYGLRFISLRYFNASGADPEGELGERHDPETHLIPNVLQAISGRKDAVTVYGGNYPTKDGTCVRDYIHVYDLCDAHLKALKYLKHKYESGVFNLGNERGYSVQDILNAARFIAGRDFHVTWDQPRPGEPAKLIADAKKAKKELGWKPNFGLEEIIAHAWAWEKQLARLD